MKDPWLGNRAAIGLQPSELHVLTRARGVSHMTCCTARLAMQHYSIHHAGNDHTRYNAHSCVVWLMLLWLPLCRHQQVQPLMCGISCCSGAVPYLTARRPLNARRQQYCGSWLRHGWMLVWWLQLSRLRRHALSMSWLNMCSRRSTTCACMKALARMTHGHECRFDHKCQASMLMAFCREGVCRSSPKRHKGVALYHAVMLA